MYINSEGIILRQVKISGGRKMLLLFTKKYGKISAGSNINEKGKSKASLAMRPFSYGNYELYKNKEYYNINSAEVKKSFFKLGEDVDKYMYSSFIMELTEKVLPENQPSPKLFNLLIDVLRAMENRNTKHETLILAYEIKVLELLGTFPQLEECVCCGKKGGFSTFSIKEGGIICEDCKQNSNDRLIYDVKFDIVSILKYFSKRPINSFEKIALDDGVSKKLQEIIREYLSYYLDVGNLKSESIFAGKF